jgi:hypothetical protein
MGLWDRITSLFFARSSKDRISEPHLAARNEAELSASVRNLLPGARGWITVKKAGSFFSEMGDDYAFGTEDAKGRSKLEAFAAQEQHRSEYEFIYEERRVYFTRLAPFAGP